MKSSIFRPTLLAGGGGGAQMMHEVMFLKPGKYVLVCNIPGHYEAGMHTALVVK